MKKKIIKLGFLALLLPLFMLSCTTEDDYDIRSESKSLISNSTKSIYLNLADNPISQLDGIPLHIKMCGVSHNSIYLSARQSSRLPCLYYEDDNSGRQQWNLIKEGNQYRIKAVSGVKKGRLYLGLKAEETQGTWPRMQSNYIAPNMLWDVQYHNENDRYTFLIGSKNKNDNSYLSAISPYVTDDLTLSKINSSGLQYWLIEPIEEYELVDIDYDFLATENTFKKVPKTVYYEPVRNYTNSTIEKVFTYEQKKIQTSRFSKTQGLVVSLTGDLEFKVKIPLILEIGLKLGLTTTKSWEYKEEKETSVSETVTRSHKWTIQPNSAVQFTAIANQYEAKVKYIAKMRGVKSRKIIYLKGYWEGINIESFDVEIKDINTQKILKRF